MVVLMPVHRHVHNKKVHYTSTYTRDVCRLPLEYCGTVSEKFSKRCFDVKL